MSCIFCKLLLSLMVIPSLLYLVMHLVVVAQKRTGKLNVAHAEMHAGRSFNVSRSQ